MKKGARRGSGNTSNDPVVVYLCKLAHIRPSKKNLGRVATRYGVRISGRTPTRRSQQGSVSGGLIEDLMGSPRLPVSRRGSAASVA